MNFLDAAYEILNQAERPLRFSLIDGDRLLDLLIQSDIGIVKQQYTVHSLDEEWWHDVIPTVSKAVMPFQSVGIEINYPISIQATARGQIFLAVLLNQHGQTQYGEIEYKSPSRAAIAATGWKTCNGWTFWRYQHAETNEWHSIDELRDTKTKSSKL